MFVVKTVSPATEITGADTPVGGSLTWPPAAFVVDASHWPSGQRSRTLGMWKGHTELT